jgi:hypothetical protein
MGLDLSSAGFDTLSSTDILGIKCSNNISTVFIFVIYMHPKSSASEYELLFQLLAQFVDIQGHRILLVGDFNISHYSPDLPIDSIGNDQKLSILYNYLNFFEVKQFNNVPNHHGRYLDLIICNESCEITKANDILTAEDPHHPSLCITLKHVSIANRSFCNLKYKQWNFKKANIQQLYDNLSKINWSFLHNCDNVNYACLLFYNKLYSVFDTCVAKTHCGSSKSFPPWFTANIIKMIKCKWQLWRSYKKKSVSH